MVGQEPSCKVPHPRRYIKIGAGLSVNVTVDEAEVGRRDRGGRHGLRGREKVSQYPKIVASSTKTPAEATLTRTAIKVPKTRRSRMRHMPAGAPLMYKRHRPRRQPSRRETYLPTRRGRTTLRAETAPCTGHHGYPRSRNRDHAIVSSYDAFFWRRWLGNWKYKMYTFYSSLAPPIWSSELHSRILLGLMSPPG